MHPAVAAVRRSLHYVLLVCRVRHSGRLRSLVAGRGTERVQLDRGCGFARRAGGAQHRARCSAYQPGSRALP